MPVRQPKHGDLEPIEIASRAAISALQLERLKWTLHRAYDKVPQYRRKFDDAGVHPREVKSLTDLARFPFTTRKDLRANYPFGMFAVPREEIIRVHASSGTTGQPTVVGYTRADLELWATVMARSIRAAGGRAGDIIHVSSAYGLSTGGLGAHYGAERLGATVVPLSEGMIERQVQLIVDFKPDIIMATPSYMLAMADAMERQGVDTPGLLAQGRHLRRRALDAGDAAGDRSQARPRRGGHLRAVRDHRSGGRAGMHRNQGRVDRLGGPLLSGDHRSGQRRCAAGRRARRAGPERRSPRKRCRWSATGRGT